MKYGILQRCCSALPSASMPYALVRVTDHGIECSGTRECAYGDGTPSEGSLLGRFCAGWSLRDGSFVAATDAQGNASLFYARVDRGVAVSNNAVQLLAQGVSADIHCAALAELLTLNFMTGDRTVFSEIKVLPPGGVLRLTPAGEIHIKTPRAEVPLPFVGSSEQAAERYAELFDAAVSRTATGEGNTGTPLSGGRDSRMLAAAIKYSGNDEAEAITLSCADEADRSDAVIAEEVAATLEIRLHRSGIQSLGMATELWKNVLCSCQTMQHGWLSQIWVECAKRYQTVFDGFGGGVATRSSHRKPELYDLISRGDIRGAVRYYAEHNKGRPIASGFPDWVQRFGSVSDFEAAGLGRFELAIREASEYPDPMSALAMMGENRRAIACSPLAIGMLGPSLRIPLADDALCRFVMSIPWRTTDRAEPQTRAVEILYPKLAGIAYSDGSGPRRPSGLGRFKTLLDGSAWQAKFIDLRLAPEFHLAKYMARKKRALTRSTAVEALGMLLRSLTSSAAAQRLLEASKVSDQPNLAMIRLAKHVWDRAWWTDTLHPRPEHGKIAAEPTGPENDSIPHHKSAGL